MSSISSQQLELCSRPAAQHVDHVVLAVALLLRMLTVLRPLLLLLLLLLSPCHSNLLD
jgi:hypothetical protein